MGVAEEAHNVKVLGLTPGGRGWGGGVGDQTIVVAHVGLGLTIRCASTQCHVSLTQTGLSSAATWVHEPQTLANFTSTGDNINE